MINQEKITQNIEVILEELGLVYKKFPNRLSLACPIHESSKTNSLTIYTNSGTWRCWSSNCHADVGKNIISFIKAVRSKNDDKEYTQDEIIEWLEKLLNISLDEEKNELHQSIFNTINISYQLNKKKKPPQKFISRENVIRELQIPSALFLKRGYLTSTLIKYDVGLCSKSAKQMSNRVVVPVYDKEYKYMVGCMGRTLKPQCQLCKKFHNENEGCPISEIDEYLSSKWINSLGFNGENYLYNYWFAEKYIKETKTAILCEGCSDVWRLEEAGIHIGLSLFGAHLTDSQSEKLEKLPLINLIVALDNDDAGNKAKSIIKEKLWRHYNIFDVVIPKKDIGELSIEETKTIFNPILEKLCPLD